MIAAAAAAQFLAAAACGGSPTASGRPPAVSMVAQVSASTVTCDTCTEGPFIWAVAAAPVTITNPGSRAIALSTVETRAFNHTRASVIATNVRPNLDFTYPDTTVPAGGSLTLEAAVVYHPLPPPADDIRLVVIVTFSDGRTARAEAQLFLTGVYNGSTASSRAARVDPAGLLRT